MADTTAVGLTIFAFLLTTALILWRPRELNEAIPAVGGAIIVVWCGSVTFPDLLQIGVTISDAAVTIMATIVMAMVLKSFGFFQWAADGLAYRAGGSGTRLFWYFNALCFMMTLFFNNDGSILITTPILLLLLKEFGLSPSQKFPFLISGALVATASSAPIGVSNIVNLIALKIVGMDLYLHTAMMFVPSMLGLLFMAALLYWCLHKQIPQRLPPRRIGPHAPSERFRHPLQESQPQKAQQPDPRFMKQIMVFVLAVRLSLFAASFVGVSVGLVAVMGSLALLVWRWVKLGTAPHDMVGQIPWHVLVFAFGMYVIIYGLNNIGLTDLLVQWMKPLMEGGLMDASLLMGGLMSVFSIFFNNHPALMVGTLTLTQMQLDPVTLKLAYLSSVIGSDIGSLFLPIGTLASLIWLHILRQHKVRIKWADYVKVTVFVIPQTVIFTLVALSLWVQWIYGG